MSNISKNFYKYVLWDGVLERGDWRAEGNYYSFPSPPPLILIFSIYELESYGKQILLCIKICHIDYWYYERKATK